MSRTQGTENRDYTFMDTVYFSKMSGLLQFHLVTTEQKCKSMWFQVR